MGEYPPVGSRQSASLHLVTGRIADLRSHVQALVSAVILDMLQSANHDLLSSARLQWCEEEIHHVGEASIAAKASQHDSGHVENGKEFLVFAILTGCIVQLLNFSMSAQNGSHGRSRQPGLLRISGPRLSWKAHTGQQECQVGAQRELLHH